MGWLDGIHGALIDVDGTLLDGDSAIPGAAEALERLRSESIRFRLVTNTTRRSRAAVGAALRRVGIAVADEEVLIPALLARARILESGKPRALLLIPDEAARDFEGIVRDRLAPDWVVVGDLGSGFTWNVMNEAFRALQRGAELLALHKNPCWYDGRRDLVVDAGAYVAGLEYAAGVNAEVVGKPAAAFFRLCLQDLGLRPSDVAVIGDDPINDAAGGAAAGCKTILVRTGKLALVSEGTHLEADLVVSSIARIL